MEILSKKNTIITVAAILVVGMGIMASNLMGKRPKLLKDVFKTEVERIETQSESDDIESIEKDLADTNLTNIDRELQDIEKELNQAL